MSSEIWNYYQGNELWLIRLGEGDATYIAFSEDRARSLCQTLNKQLEELMEYDY